MESFFTLVLGIALLLFACRLASRMTGIRLSPVRLGRWARGLCRRLWGRKPPRGRARPVPRERHFGGER
ncbi:MAG: hypothetical protein ACE5IM_10860 [Nitrospinota bacterium]